MSKRHNVSNLFLKLFGKYGLTDEGIAQITHRHPKTVKRWLDGQIEMPQCCQELCRLKSNHEIPLPEAWAGWRITPQAISTPEGEHLTPRELKAAIWVFRNSGL